MSTKSLTITARLDVAKSSHDCRFNDKHRIKMGDVRLKVRNRRSWLHYCLPCARIIVERTQVKLSTLQSEIMDAIASSGLSSRTR